MTVHIINNSKIRIKTQPIKRKLYKILSFLSLRDYNLNISFVDNSEIRRLNKKYRNIDRATDVLSFSMFEGKFSNINPSKEMGDIVISSDIAKKFSNEHNISIEENICLLSIHGILHITGFDHDSKKKRNDMRQMEDLLKKLINEAQ